MLMIRSCRWQFGRFGGANSVTPCSFTYGTWGFAGDLFESQIKR